MVRLSHLDGSKFVVNLDVIATIESAPDTVLTLLNGRKLLVRETVDEIVEQATSYRRRIFHGEPVVLSSGI